MPHPSACWASGHEQSAPARFAIALAKGRRELQRGLAPDEIAAEPVFRPDRAAQLNAILAKAGTTETRNRSHCWGEPPA